MELFRFYRGFPVPPRPADARVSFDIVGDEVLVRANREGFAWLSGVFASASDGYEGFRIQRIDSADLGGPLDQGSKTISVDHIENADQLPHVE